MAKQDARKLGREELLKRRLQIVKFWREGIPVMQIVERTGLSWPTVSKSIKLFQSGGESALSPASRGRKQGTGRELSPAQEIDICRRIRSKRPFNYGWSKKLWDRETVGLLIAQTHESEVSDRLLGYYLGRWGLSAANSKRGPSGCTKEIRSWLDGRYDAIHELAKQDRAEIYWLNKPKVLKTNIWLEAGLPGEIVQIEQAQPPKAKLSMLSVTSNQGKLIWVIVPGRIDADRQIKFVQALLHDTRKKSIFLIRTGEKIYNHHSFMYWINQNTNKVRVFPEMFVKTPQKSPSVF
jgi:transposase